MNKQQQIAELNRQIKVGSELMQVAKQNHEVAARIVSEAQSALNELGGSKGQARKGSKHKLSEETKLKLKASLTNIKRV